MSSIKEVIKKLLDKNLIRFFLVAGLNTAFGYFFYAFLLFIGFHYVWATLIGQIVGVFFNFKTYGSLVFKNKNNKLIFRFIGVYVITYFCNIICITLLIRFFNTSDYLAGAIMIIPIGLLGFILNRQFVFKKRENEEKICRFEEK